MRASERGPPYPSPLCSGRGVSSGRGPSLTRAAGPHQRDVRAVWLKFADVTGVTAGGTCVLLAPADSSARDFFENVFAPAVSSVHLQPVQAPSLTHPEDSQRLQQALADAAVAVADARHPDPTLYCQMGMSEAVHTPMIVIAASVDDLPMSVTEDRFIPFEDESSARWAETLQTLIAERVGDQVRKVRPLPGVPPGRHDEVSGFSLRDAEQLMAELFRDGCSLETIEQELLRAGAPSSWVAIRVKRRPGW